MSFKDNVLRLVLDKITETSKAIRDIEEKGKKFSVDPEGEGVYTALVGYREALQDMLLEIRSLNENQQSDRDF